MSDYEFVPLHGDMPGAPLEFARDVTLDLRSHTSRNDEPQTPVSVPGLATWQCPGCGMIYTMMVNSCGCQQHRWIQSSNKIQLYPEHKAEMP